MIFISIYKMITIVVHFVMVTSSCYKHKMITIVVHFVIVTSSGYKVDDKQSSVIVLV